MEAKNIWLIKFATYYHQLQPFKTNMIGFVDFFFNYKILIHYSNCAILFGLEFEFTFWDYESLFFFLSSPNTQKLNNKL